MAMMLISQIVNNLRKENNDDVKNSYIISLALSDESHHEHNNSYTD